MCVACGGGGGGVVGKLTSPPRVQRCCTQSCSIMEGVMTQVVSSPSLEGKAQAKAGGAGGGLSAPPAAPPGPRSETLGLRRLRPSEKE